MVSISVTSQVSCFLPTEVGRVYRLLEMASEGSPGHGPIHLLSACAAEIGF